MEPILVGALIGAGVALVIFVLATFGANARDSVIIAASAEALRTAPADVLGTVRGWASHHGYVESHQGPVVRFQKGKGLLVAPTVIEVSQVPGGTRIDAYSPMTGIGRKRELALSSNYFIGLAPRKKSLREFNSLLTALGHPPLG